MYRIKQLPEDFIVRELMELRLEDAGRYSYYLLKKTGSNTVDAVGRVAKRLGVNPKYVNFAGSKDKQAVTEQYISISRGPKKDLEMEGITLRFLGKGDERLNLGKLKGNEFEITVRNIEKKPRPIRKFRNLFDSQRFGKNMDNHVIGKAIIMKDFRKACEMIDDGKIKTHLASRPNDYVGALKTLPKKVLQLYVHAYQSFLWNGMAAGSFEESLPLIGFYTDETDEVKRVLEREGIRREDFIIRQMPELSAEGGERAVFAEVGRLQVRELEDDELNPGEKKVRVSFRLGKGSYATQVVREMFA